MSNYFANLPAAQIPRNALLDFSPINNAIDSNRQNALQTRQLDMRQEEQTYQRGRDAKQDARVEQQDMRQQVQLFGKRAEAIDQITDPAQRQALWGKIIASHPNRAALTPEYLDPMNGPKLVMAEAGQWRDPRDSQMKDLDIQQKQAQIQKLQREPPGGEAPSNVREYQYFQSLPPEQQQQYLTMKRAEKYLDNGTSFIQPNPVAPGQNIRVIPKDLATAEQQKVIGKETGERQMGMPKAQASLESAAAKTELVRGKIQQARSLVSPYSVGYGSVLKNIPNTQALNLKEAVNTIVANMGFEELQDMRQNSPTGGALGAIAVQELEMLQKTRTSLEQAQSPEQFNKALDELDTFMQGADSRRRKAFDATYGGAQQSTQQPGQTGMPKPGDIIDGYRYKGGNPGDPNSYERL